MTNPKIQIAALKAAEIAGCVCIVAGISMIYVPAALLAAGFIAVLEAALAAYSLKAAD